MDREEAVRLINQLRSGALSDAEISAIVVRLDTILPDPHWYDYTIDRVPELAAEEVVNRALLYRPIIL